MKKEKKNYLVSFLITLFWWVAIATMVIFVDPVVMEPLNYLPFLGVLFLAVLFSASLLLADTIGGLVVAVGVVFWGLLRVWNISNWFNSLLILGIVMVIEIYRWGGRKEIPEVG